MVKTTAYLSLGSNLGRREENLRRCIQELEQLGSVTAVSGFYETEPVEVLEEQPWYLNCAVALNTQLAPERLLAGALEIERRMGRQRARPKEPRTIDVDVIFFGDSVLNTPELTIPHPSSHRRRFVLEPLAEIAPDLMHPLLRHTVRELLATLPAGGGKTRLCPPR